MRRPSRDLLKNPKDTENKTQQKYEGQRYKNITQSSQHLLGPLVVIACPPAKKGEVSTWSPSEPPELGTPTPATAARASVQRNPSLEVQEPSQKKIPCFPCSFCGVLEHFLGGEVFSLTTTIKHVPLKKMWGDFCKIIFLGGLLFNSNHQTSSFS